MAWKQILQPNLDDPSNPLYIWQGGSILTDWYGWCLAVTAGSFGAQGSSYSAKTAWQACGTKHRDYNIPEGLWVPLWYEGGEYGHVVEGYRQGNNLTIYSSPYTHKATFDIFNGEIYSILDYVGRVYGVGGFSGWSETLLDSRVVEYVADAPKPEPKPEPTPEPEPEPEPGDDNNNNGKDDDMSTPTEPTEPSDPTEHPTQQLAGGILEEAIESADWFSIPNWARLVVYIIADLMIISAMLIPDIINAIQAPTLSVFGEYLAKVLVEAGTCLLMVFKLIKKK